MDQGCPVLGTALIWFGKSIVLGEQTFILWMQSYQRGMGSGFDRYWQ